MMGNHFHLLLRVPEREKFLRKFNKGTKVSREERLFEHLKLLYSRAYLTQLKAELEVMEKKGMTALYEKTMADYIDLNPLRAGLVSDPKDYRWCGYGEAMGGSKRARIGLCRALGVAMDSWVRGGR